MTRVPSRHREASLTLAFALLTVLPGLATGGRAVTLFGLSSDGRVLVEFDSTAPGTIVRAAGITGLQPTEVLRGIDVRPATGEVYGLGVITGVTDTVRLHRVDPDTGLTTAIGPAITGVTTGAAYGVDFNPVSDRVRVVNDGDENLRINPNTGARADAPTSDTDLNPASTVGAVAHDRNLAGTTGTTLYGIDTVSDSLVTIGGVNGSPSPNTGSVLSVGLLGVDATGTAGFDVESATGTLFAALTVGGQNGLYTIDPGTGAATLVGLIGDGTLAITGLAAVSQVTLIVSPGSGTYGTTQNFDIQLFLHAPGRTIASGQITFDGLDVTQVLASCFRIGVQPDGTIALRCPGISGAALGAGIHTLTATVSFVGGGSATGRVVLTVVQVTEP
jgi:hypothetical protein